MKTQKLKLNVFILAVVGVLLTSCGNDGPFDRDCIRIRGEGAIVTRELVVADFNALSSLGSFNIEIIEAEEQRVVATGHENIVPLVNTEVSGEDYHITLPSGCYSNFELSVTVETPHLELISSAGSGNVSIRSLPEAGNLTITTTGSGSIRSTSTLNAEDWIFLESTGSGGMFLSIETDSLYVSQTGSGNIELNGEVRTQDIRKAGSGSYFTYDLVSNTINLTSSGSGLAQVNATDELRISLTGSGSLFYRGNPDIVIASTVGSGTVVAVD